MTGSDQSQTSPTTPPPATSSPSPVPPPIPPQQMPAMLQMGFNFPNPSLPPESIRAMNEFLIHDSDNRLQYLDNEGERKARLHRWYIVAGVILLVVFCAVAGGLAVSGHEKFAKTLLTLIITLIAGGFGGWGIGKANK